MELRRTQSLRVEDASGSRSGTSQEFHREHKKRMNRRPPTADENRAG